MAELYGGLEKSVYKPLLKEWVLAWSSIVRTPVTGRDFDKRVDILVDEWMEDWKTTHASASTWLKQRRELSPKLMAHPDELRLLFLRMLDQVADEWLPVYASSGIRAMTWLDEHVMAGSAPSRMAVIHEYVKVKEAGKKLTWLLFMSLGDRLRSHPHLLGSPLAEQLLEGLHISQEKLLDGMLRWTIEDERVPKADVEEALRQRGWAGLQLFPRTEPPGLGPKLPTEVLNSLLTTLQEPPSADRLQRLLEVLRQVPGVTIEASGEPQDDSGEPQVEAEMKTCPDCAEPVRAAARKCRFCGYQFQ